MTDDTTDHGDMKTMRFAKPLALLAGLTLSAPTLAAAPAAMLYKSPQCDCCEEYADYLRANGYTVTVVPTHSLSLVKRQHGVPQALEGCHTMLVDGYAVEGHVPASVLNRLLAERPAEIRGISLPGMPTGSPGMSGPKVEPFTIYTLPRDAASEPAVYAVE